jgi:hypothetical protein
MLAALIVRLVTRSTAFSRQIVPISMVAALAFVANLSLFLATPVRRSGEPCDQASCRWLLLSLDP